MRAFSISERRKLESSPYIFKITGKNRIQFTESFKKLILAGSEEGLTREEFFNVSLGVRCFDKKYVDSCLNRWRKQDREKDVPKLRRGRSKSIHKMSIDEIKAENAYMKEVIAHLKKLRGLADDEL